MFLNDAGPNNTIGSGNVIAGNAQSGIMILSDEPTFGNGSVVVGNSIGTNAANTPNIGNGANGIFIYGSSGNTIGGTAVAAANVISGNNQAGVVILTPAASALADHNELLGNFIGTNMGGTAAVPNQVRWCGDHKQRHNTIGPNNVISGNLGNGVLIESLSATGTAVGDRKFGVRQQNRHRRNRNQRAFQRPEWRAAQQCRGKHHRCGIGFRGIRHQHPDFTQQRDFGKWSGGHSVLWRFAVKRRPGKLHRLATKMGPLSPESPIQGFGVFINNLGSLPSSETIGGTAIGAGNLISGNGNAGIEITGPQNAVGGLNSIQGNVIGLDRSGNRRQRLDRDLYLKLREQYDRRNFDQQFPRHKRTDDPKQHHLGERAGRDPDLWFPLDQ